MPGLVPGIHVFLASGAKDVDGRDNKPGHDGDLSDGISRTASYANRFPEWQSRIWLMISVRPAFL
jgi:hypothetical protein